MCECGGRLGMGGKILYVFLCLGERKTKRDRKK